ncbi:MAG: response regulator [Bacteroidales bacterium]|nr:MAG: response regulator [Bacteroidales bacterium]
MSELVKILVADDSPSIQLSIQSMLMADQSNKYLIHNVNDGRQACIMALNERPDLILIDIEMPVMDGIDAIKKIKTHNLLKDIPIIVMSSSRKFQEAFIAGVDDFLIKPFNQYELLLRIQLNLKLANISAELKNQNELLVLQKQEVTQQKELIEKQQIDLLSGIRYASYIQKAILPEDVLIDELFSSNFILNKPRSIVSGDFYWVTQKNDLKFFAVGDCTGHGISGALMTMAGIAFLNEIVNDYNEYEADKILNELRLRVEKLLHQRGTAGEASNGMDIALCVYNSKKRIIQYAGANNPIYIIHADKSLDVFKADRMPVGIHFNHERPFTSKECIISQGDEVYLFSDGFPDQFGGSNGQKFRYDQFRELLIRCSSSPMNEQLKILENTLDDWMIGFEQIDDILVMGIKF